MDRDRLAKREELKERIVDIDFKQYSISLGSPQEKEQLQRIKGKIDLLAKTYEDNDFLKDQLRVQTEKHRSRNAKLSIDEASTFVNNEILKRCEQFFKLIENKQSEHLMAEDLRNKFSEIYKRMSFRWIGITSYSAFTFMVSYLMYKKYMYGNSLMFGITYLAIGIVPSVILIKSVRSQNQAERVIFFLKYQHLIE